MKKFFILVFMAIQVQPLFGTGAIGNLLERMQNLLKSVAPDQYQAHIVQVLSSKQDLRDASTIQAVSADIAAEMLQPNGTQWLQRLLFLMVDADNRDAVDLLMLAGIDVNVRGDKGKTPIMRAAEDGLLDMVTYLLSKGASATLVDSSDESPLIYAVKGRFNDQKYNKNREAIVKKLLDATDFLLTKDLSSKTAVDYALQAPEDKNLLKYWPRIKIIRQVKRSKVSPKKMGTSKR